MNWKKTEHFKETEFGPMKTGHTVEYTSCESCEKLRTKLLNIVKFIDDYSHEPLPAGLVEEARQILEEK